MIHYLDRTFCPKRDCPNTDCPLFFDEEKYSKVCERIGFEMDVAWFAEQPECPPKEPPLSTIALARRTAKRRRERELLRQMKKERE